MKPLIFLTYWSAAARISSSVAGGSKLYKVLMFRHTSITSSDGQLAARRCAAPTERTVPARTAGESLTPR